MKIYSSELLNTASVNTGDLTVTTGDRLIIADLNPATNVGSAGLSITAGTASTAVDVSTSRLDQVSGLTLSYLDGQGVERNLNEFILAQANMSGSTLNLRNAAGENIIAGITLPTGGTGGGGGTETNATNQTLPVKVADNLGQNEFIDSVISEAGTFVDAITATAQAAAAVTMGSTLTIDNILVGQQAAFHTRFSAGLSTTILIGGTEYIGTLTSLTAGSTASFVLSSGDFTGANEIADNAAILLPVADRSRTVTGITIGTGSSTGNLTVSGNLEVQGTTTTVDSVTVEIADQFIQLATPSDQAATLADRNVGILTFVGKADSVDANIQGIRYNATANAWEVSSNIAGVSLASGLPDTDTDWTAISTHSGTISKAVVNVASITANSPTAAGSFGAITASFNGAGTADTDEVATSAAINSAITITIDIEDATGKLLPVGTSDGTSSDATVQVFENNLQIIPDEISVATNTVTITLPIGYGTTSGLRIVIIG